MTPQQILKMLIDLTPEQILEICEGLGPCQGAMDLHAALMTLQDLKTV